MHLKTVFAAIMVFAAAQAAVTKDCTTTVAELVDVSCYEFPWLVPDRFWKTELIDCHDCYLWTSVPPCDTMKTGSFITKRTWTHTSCSPSATRPFGTLAMRAPTTSTMKITKEHPQIASSTSAMMTITLENALTITKDHAQAASPTCTTTLPDWDFSFCNEVPVATATSLIDCNDCALEVPQAIYCIDPECLPNGCPDPDWTTTVAACSPSVTPPSKTLAIRATTPCTKTITETNLDCSSWHLAAPTTTTASVDCGECEALRVLTVDMPVFAHHFQSCKTVAPAVATKLVCRASST